MTETTTEPQTVRADRLRQLAGEFDTKSEEALEARDRLPSGHRNRDRLESVARAWRGAANSLRMVLPARRVDAEPVTADFTASPTGGDQVVTNWAGVPLHLRPDSRRCWELRDDEDRMGATLRAIEGAMAEAEQRAEDRIVAWLRAEAAESRSPAEAANFRRSANRIEAGQHLV